MLNIEMWDGGLSQLRAVSGWSSGFLDRHLEAFFRDGDEGIFASLNLDSATRGFIRENPTARLPTYRSTLPYVSDESCHEWKLPVLTYAASNCHVD